jgi:hypothetical protein
MVKKYLRLKRSINGGKVRQEIFPGRTFKKISDKFFHNGLRNIRDTGLPID